VGDLEMQKQVSNEAAAFSCGHQEFSGNTGRDRECSSIGFL